MGSQQWIVEVQTWTMVVGSYKRPLVMEMVVDNW